jgi:hypothetical protein
MKPEAGVAELTAFLRNANPIAIRRFLEACPRARLKDASLAMLTPHSPRDTILTAINQVANDYCTGGNCELGIKLSQASWTVAVEAFEAEPTIGHLLSAGRAVVNGCFAFGLVGRHTELVEWAQNGTEWLSDAVEWLGRTGALADEMRHEIDDIINTDIITILQHQAEAHIELGDFDDAEQTLHRARGRLRGTGGPSHYLVEKIAERLRGIARRQATELPPAEVTNFAPMIRDMLHEQLAAIESLKRGASDDSQALIEQFVEGLKPQIEQEVPDEMTKPEALKWFDKSRPMMNLMANHFFGGPADADPELPGMRSLSLPELPGTERPSGRRRRPRRRDARNP